MRKLSLFIAFAMLAALTMVSCNNKPKEPTQEEVQEMKQALADSVLAQIDAIADECILAASEKFTFRSRELTEKEKALKPNYLLNPSEANNLITKSQKIYAIGMLRIDMGVRYLYDMPVEETKEAITKLALDVNVPIELSASKKQQDYSDIFRSQYNNCKANNELSAFWQYYYACAVENSYILAQNPELYFSKISEKEWQAYTKRFYSTLAAIEELAKYDEEMATVQEFINRTRVTESVEEMEKAYATVESAKQHFISNKDKYIAMRNALLQ